MKYCIIIHELNLSGGSIASQQVVSYLMERGHDIDLVVIGGYGNFETIIDRKIIENPNITTLLRCKKNVKFGKAGYIITSIFRLMKYLRKTQPENIMCWGKEFSVIAYIITRIFKIKCRIIGVNFSLIENHIKNTKMPFLPYIKRRIYKLFLPKINFWVAQSKGIADEIVNDYSVQPDKVNVIYPAISDVFFDNKHEKKKENRFVFVGRLSDEKDPFRLLENCKDFLTSHPDWKLDLVGDGDLRDKLEKTVQNYNLQNQVIFHGFQRDVIPFITKAKALLLTSKFEGFGMVLAESCALGTLVISINCPSGPSEIIQNGANGFLVNSDDEFKNRLEYIAKNDFSSFESIRNSVQKFKASVILREYEQLLEKQL